MRMIPAALQTHLNQSDTTTTRLLKISLINGDVYGLTTLDRDVPYDDGEGEITYVATNGFDPSTFSADIGYSVDNAEGYALISDDIPGVTVEMAEAGDLDDGQWVCYLVNYEDLSMGHAILDAGDLGEVRTRYGMIWIPELLSYAMRLRQPIGSVFSRTCRAIFGTPANSQAGCGIDLTPLWVNGEVTAVGAETDRTFTGDVITDSGQPIAPNPGRVQWLTGANTGREYSVEELDSSGTVTLNETTPYPIEVGDTYRIRPDCRKRYIEDCIGVWDNGINFKGEPLIPVGDGVAIQTPGGQLSGGGGFVGEVPEVVEPTPEPTEHFFVAMGSRLPAGASEFEAVVLASADGSLWVPQVSSAPNKIWVDGIWVPELSLFVAVSSTGDAGTNEIIATSPNGAVWTSHSVPTNVTDLRNLAYSPSLGLLAAVGTLSSPNNIVTSPDGITWTSRSSGSGALQDITWSATHARFAAVGTSASATGRFRVSVDGINWVAINGGGANEAYYGIIRVESLNRFIAVGALNAGGGRCLTSTDASAWTARTIPSSVWAGIAWSPSLSLLCAVGAGATQVATSPTGTTWTARTLTGSLASQQWLDIAWSEELQLFVAVGVLDGYPRIMSSADGINWTGHEPTPPFSVGDDQPPGLQGIFAR